MPPHVSYAGVLRTLLLLNFALRRSGSLMLCLHEGCDRHASYGAPNTRNRTACATHKAADHVYLIGQLCAYANGTSLACVSRGAYGLSGGAGERWCKRHKKAGMMHLLSRKCQDKECSKQPIFGVVNTTAPLYCREHKSAAHVDVVNRRCQKCDRQGVFGDPAAHRNFANVNRRRWGRRGLPPAAPLYCREHRLHGHLNLLSKKCRAEGCSKQPYFGDPVARVPLWCNKHKPPGHEDVKNRRCCHPYGCTRHPAYGEPSGIATYCLQHKAPNHIPLIGYRCDLACVCLTNHAAAWHTVVLCSYALWANLFCGLGAIMALIRSLCTLTSLSWCALLLCRRTRIILASEPKEAAEMSRGLFGSPCLRRMED